MDFKKNPCTAWEIGEASNLIYLVLKPLKKYGTAFGDLSVYWRCFHYFSVVFRYFVFFSLFFPGFHDLKKFLIIVHWFVIIFKIVWLFFNDFSLFSRCVSLFFVDFSMMFFIDFFNVLEFVSLFFIIFWVVFFAIYMRILHSTYLQYHIHGRHGDSQNSLRIWSFRVSGLNK